MSMTTSKALFGYWDSEDMFNVTKTVNVLKHRPGDRLSKKEVAELMMTGRKITATLRGKQ